MSATANGGEKAGEVGHRRHRSNSDPQAAAIALAQIKNEEGKKASVAMRTGSLGSNSRTPGVMEGKQSRFAALGRLFKPWRWKRKKKSDKFEQTSRTLERKISMRATKEELIKKGVLLPESEKHKDPFHSQANGTIASHDHHPSFHLPVSEGTAPVIPDISVLHLPDLEPESSELKFSYLPDPPIPLSEIGPIPPPPMFCNNPSPRFLHSAGFRDRIPLPGLLGPPDPHHHLHHNTSVVEEVPAKEPQLSAIPKKSALKKRNAAPMMPTATSGSPYHSFPTVMPLAAQNSPPPPYSAENKENSPQNELDNLAEWRDYYGEDETCQRVAKIARKDSLAIKLSQRPQLKDLIEKNIIHIQSERERQATREVIGNKLIRRLSLRPTAEELEQRNILKNQTPEEMRKEKEQKKKMLLRKLSFRATIDELKERKIITFDDYVEVTQAQEYDRRADKPWTRLTPKDKAAIRKELNEFKSMEMHVHEDSRHLTRFHRP